MNHLESLIVLYLLNSLWQVPLVYAAACLAARLARPVGPCAEHRIWVGALSLQALLPALHADPKALLQQALAFLAQAWHATPSEGQVRVLISPGVGSGDGLRLPHAALIAILVPYAGISLYFLARMVLALYKTVLLRREAQPLPLNSEQAATVVRFQNHFALDSGSIAFAASPALTGPVAVGIRRTQLIFPLNFFARVTKADLDSVLAHELAHLRRHDFAKNLAYEFLSLPFAYHPILWMTRARLAETREIVCDSMAADVIEGREHYARSLLRLASVLAESTPVPTLHAIGIFDANILERRIMHLINKPTQLKAAQRFAIAAATLALTLTTGISALALHTTVIPEGQTQNPHYVQVKPDLMKVVSRVQPEYPQEAKEHKIQGSVIIGAVISKDGIAEKLKVISGPKELQQSAIGAVSHWKWEPYLLNGEPIEVETSVTVVYSLAK